MFKKHLLHALLMLFVTSISLAQFQYSYGNLDYQYGKSVQPTFLSWYGYIIAGQTNYGGLGYTDAHLIQTDQNGNNSWSRVYGGYGYDYFNSVREARGDYPLNYVAAGYTNSFGAGSYDMWLVGTNAWGDPLFSRTFGGAEYDRGFCVQQIKEPTGKPGFIVVGETKSFPHYFPGLNVYVAKTDYWGNLTGSVVIGTPGDDSGNWIEQTKDGGYIIAGYTTAGCSVDATSNRNIYVIKLDPYLNVVWSRILSGTGSAEDVAFCVKESDYDGSYIITGHTRSYGVNGDPFLLNLTPGGGLNWFKVYSGANFESGQSVLVTKEEYSGTPQYIVAGYSNSFSSTNNYDAHTFKTDLNGNLSWSRVYGGLGHDYSYEIAHDLVGTPGYILAGTTPSFGAGKTDVLLLNLTNYGKSYSHCEREVRLEEKREYPCITKNAQYVHVRNTKEDYINYEKIAYSIDKCSTPSRLSGNNLPEDLIGTSALRVMPVPATTHLHVEFNEDLNGGTLNVFDIKGNLVKQTSLAEGSEELSVSDLAPGIYMLQGIRADGTMESAKFVKE